MGGMMVVVALEVPWAYFTTQGISPCGDADYGLRVLGKELGRAIKSIQ